MSARRSTGVPAACSGLMYAAVPMITPASLSHGLSQRGVGGIGGCRGRAPDDGRKSKIEHLDQAGGCDDDVAGFQVPMYHSFFVRRFQGLRDLLGPWKCFGQG